jgi:hypothetical protein
MISTTGFRCTVRLLSLVMLLAAPARATTVRIRTMYPDTEALPKVLVVTKSLESDRKEVSRDLTGLDGFGQPMELAPGLYEAIATYPYGQFLTQVEDFVVSPGPSVTIEIHLNIDSDERVNLNAADAHVRVLDRQGRPAVNAWVIGRNADATTGTSVARTDERGLANVSVPVDGALIMVIYHGETWSEPAYSYEQTGIADCTEVCLARAKAKIGKQLRLIEIKLP